MILRAIIFFSFYLSCLLLHADTPDIQFMPWRQSSLTESEKIEIAGYDQGHLKWIITPINFSIGQPIDFFIDRPLLGKKPGALIERIVINKKGILETWPQLEPTRLIVSARGYLPGEKVLCRFNQCDRETVVPFYPMPLIKKSDEGVVLWAELKDLLLQSYAIHIDHISQEESYLIRCTSWDTVMEKTVQGPLTILETPAIAGKNSGIATFEVILEDQTLTLELPWGLSLIGYAKGNVLSEH